MPWLLTQQADDTKCARADMCPKRRSSLNDPDLLTRKQAGICAHLSHLLGLIARSCIQHTDITKCAACGKQLDQPCRDTLPCAKLLNWMDHALGKLKDRLDTQHSAKQGAHTPD